MLILRWLATSGSETWPMPTGTAAQRGDAHRPHAPENLQTQVGRAIYAARKAIVEPVFGQIKQARGFRQFFVAVSGQSAGRMGPGLYGAQHFEASSSG